METNNHNIEEEEILSPLLEKLRKQNPYKVPEGYFAHTEDEIMMKIKENKQTKVRRIGSFTKISIGIAASLILGIGIYFLISPRQEIQRMNSTELRLALKTLPDEELSNYVMKNSNAINDELIAQTIDINKNNYKLNIQNMDSSLIDSYINDVDETFITE